MTNAHGRIRAWLHIVLIIVTITLGVWWWRVSRVPQAVVTLPNLKTVVSRGDITVSVMLDTGQDAINAGEIYIRFDPTYLEVKSIETDNSIFSLWVNNSPSYSNSDGTIGLAGGMPTPGHSGKGQIAQITFATKRSGQTEITYTTKSRVLKNDGKGTAMPLRLPPKRLYVK